MSLMKLVTGRKGMTIVELLVALAILGVLIPLIVSVLISGFGVLGISARRSSIQRDLRFKSDYLLGELRNVKSISSDPTAYPAGESYALLLKQVDGEKYLCKQVRQSGEVISETIIGGATYSISFSPAETNATLSVRIVNYDGEQTLEMAFEILLENVSTINIPGAVVALYYDKY